MVIQRFAKAEREVSGRRRRHGFRSGLERLRMGHRAPIFDLGQELPGFVMLRLDLEDHAEDPDGSHNIALRRAQFCVGQRRERSC